MSLNGKDLAAIAKKHPVGVGSALLSIVLLVFLYFRSNKIDEVQTRLEEVTAQGERIKTNIKYSAQLDNQLGELNKVLDEVASRTVHAGKLAQNLQYFYKLESDCGVALIDLRQGNVISAPTPKNGTPAPYNSLPFSVGVQGAFADVMTFMRKLENGEHFSRINSASLKPAGSGQATLSIAVQLLGEP